MEQAPLEFWVFDIVQFDGKDLRGLPLIKRKQILNKLLSAIAPVNLPFKENPYQFENKMEFFYEVLEQGEEGLVLKNINQPYISETSRRRDVMLKMKRGVHHANDGQEIDCFISGFVPSDPGKGWANLIGGVKLSVILKKSDGTEEDHWLATVGSIPYDLRTQMTVTKDGVPTLDPKYLGMVLTCTGQVVSHRSRRLMHATVDWSHCWRADRDKFSCLMDEEWLESQILN